MGSRQVIARFEAERQALALMDHPNIARVIDGGTTEGDRPYFVMESVKGVPITKFFDKQRLTPWRRAIWRPTRLPCEPSSATPVSCEQFFVAARPVPLVRGAHPRYPPAHPQMV